MRIQPVYEELSWLMDDWDREGSPSLIVSPVRSIQPSRSILPTLQYPNSKKRLLHHLYDYMLLISNDSIPECSDLDFPLETTPLRLSIAVLECPKLLIPPSIQLVKSLLNPKGLKEFNRQTFQLMAYEPSSSEYPPFDF